MTLITTSEDLLRFIDKAKASEFITVDTEFMRERTYFAQLCLVQVATDDTAVAIDPLADGIDLGPLFDVLRDESIIKVFHAARQDLEIFVKMIGEVPKPLFDTQIAAMVFGYGDQVGYEPLVRDITGVQVDKGSRFTDWSRRPLSRKQLDYALGDVTHLRDVYRSLAGRLAATNRHHWVKEEMEALSDPALYCMDPSQAWRRLKLRNPKTRELGPIMALAEWREHEAQHKNAPRSRIIKDDALFELARAQPASPEDLAALRSIPKGFERSAAAEHILQAIKCGQAIEKSDLPTLHQRKRDPVPPDVVDLLRVLLKRQCELHDVAPKLLATSSDLDAIALDDHADVPALSGWRREIFGNMALQLKHGKLALGLEGKRVNIHNL